jgi:recombinational DNA repair ATPase RecF
VSLRVGRPAEAGILTRVHCENFMCHHKLSLDLGPHANFISGMNGSGKSAILAALQVIYSI